MTIDLEKLKILNLTLHPASPEQLEAGVFDCRPATREELIEELTFNKLPKHYDVDQRVERILHLANHELSYYRNKVRILERDSKWKGYCQFVGFSKVMIGGAPFLMHDLQDALRKDGYSVVYAFSERQSVEFKTEDGVVKKSVFMHRGFVNA